MTRSAPDGRFRLAGCGAALWVLSTLSGCVLMLPVRVTNPTDGPVRVEKLRHAHGELTRSDLGWVAPHQSVEYPREFTRRDGRYHLAFWDADGRKLGAIDRDGADVIREVGGDRIWQVTVPVPITAAKVSGTGGGS